MKSYTLKDIEEINSKYSFNDIYFTPEYGLVCQHTDQGIWELLVWNEKIALVYIKKEIINNNTKYYHIYTPYGYTGLYKLQDISDEELNQFNQDYKEWCQQNNIITECLRESPYNSNVISKNNVTKKELKSISVSVDLTGEYENYMKKVSKTNIRAIKSAIKHNFKVFHTDVTMDNLKKYYFDLYYSTMDRNNASSYYYFPEEYYQTLIDKLGNHLMLFVVNNSNDQTIACSLYFCYGKYMHYHLGGANIDNNPGVNNLLHNYAIQYGIKNGYELLHLGCGITCDDNLLKFKKQIGTEYKEYYIVKNIIDKEQYVKLCQENKKSLDDISKFPVYLF